MDDRQTSTSLSATSTFGAHAAWVDNVQVSPGSRWEDPDWTFEANTPGQHRSAHRLRWCIALPDGTALTDQRWTTLRNEMKALVLASREGVRDGHKNKTGLARASTQSYLTYFICWMARNNYASVAELDADAFEQYVEDLARFLSVETDQDEVEISPAGVVEYLSIWYHLSRWKSQMRRHGVASLEFNPFLQFQMNVVAKKIATKAKGFIPPIPDEVAIPIMTAAHHFIGVPADDIIAYANLYDEVEQEMGADFSIPSRRRRSEGVSDLAKQRLDTFSFTTLPGQDGPWRDPINQHHTYQMLNAMRMVRAACVIVIQSQGGMRISEICGLKAGTNPETGLPACVSIRRSHSGLADLFYVGSLLSKTVDSPTETEWLIGSRPVGSNLLPAPVRALDVLQRLFEPRRRKAMGAGRTALLVGLSSRGAIEPASATILSNDLKDFIERYVDLACLPDTNRHGEDLARYRDTNGRATSTHQWRKTFALYVHRVDSRMTPAIAQQFKHLSLAMTEQGYLGNNPGLLADMNSVAMQRTAMFMYE